VKRYQVIALALLSFVGAILAACNLQRCSEGAACAISNGAGPSAIPSPTVAATPTPSPRPSSSPVDPCNPVTGVRASGPQEVKIGEVIAFEVTPVSPAGPLEGKLDYCNVNRFPTVENASANLRCVGECGGWKAQFLALAVGPFSVQFRVEGAVSPTIQGTVVR
jgi:hypothetical protein